MTARDLDDEVMLAGRYILVMPKQRKLVQRLPAADLCRGGHCRIVSNDTSVV